MWTKKENPWWIWRILEGPHFRTRVSVVSPPLERDEVNEWKTITGFVTASSSSVDRFSFFDNAEIRRSIADCFVPVLSSGEGNHQRRTKWNGNRSGRGHGHGHAHKSSVSYRAQLSRLSKSVSHVSWYQIHESILYSLRFNLFSRFIGQNSQNMNWFRIDSALKLRKCCSNTPRRIKVGCGEAVEHSTLFRSPSMSGFNFALPKKFKNHPRSNNETIANCHPFKGKITTQIQISLSEKEIRDNPAAPHFQYVSSGDC